MSDFDFNNAICALHKPQESRTIVKILLVIRKEVEWPKNGNNIALLRQKGCLKHIVKILNLHKNAMDVCLSILGNCCMDKLCARDVMGIYNILTPLSQLVQRYAEEDSVNGRIFRIIGNLCQHRDMWANTIIDRKPIIISHIVTVVKNFSDGKEYSEATITMAIRALRLLLNSTTVIALVKKFEVLKAVGAVFIKLVAEWQEQGKNQHLLHHIIRLFLDYSRYKCYHSIVHMRNTPKGDSLLQLSNVLLLSPKRVVTIVMNFIRISQLRSELPIPEICDKFIDEILKNLHSKALHEDCKEYIICLCYMLDNPANRSNERCGKCLPVLLKILEGLNEPTDKALELSVLIITTLNKCTYDESLIQVQLKYNIIEILLQKLHRIVGVSSSIEREHKKKKYKNSQLLFRRLEWRILGVPGEEAYGKRKCVCLDNSNVNTGFRKQSELLAPQSPPPSTISEESLIRSRQLSLSPYSSDDEISFHFSRYERTPSPCSSIDSFPVSCSSPPLPSAMAIDSDSDDYSPVCSEADSNDHALIEHEMLDNEDMMEIDIKGTPVEEFRQDDEEEETEVPDTTKNLKTNLIVGISRLLKSFSKIRPPIPQLGSEELLLTLLKCCELFDSPVNTYVNPIEAVSRILESPEYLIPLMKNNFIEMTYNLTKIKHNMCRTCVDHMCIGEFVLKRLSSMAESEVGKGDIAHKLLRGTNDLKEQLVLVIPYIIKNKSILAKLMLNCGGLEILMQLLQEGTVLKERTCKVLCAMASKNLEIANPTEVAISFGKRKIVTIEKYKLTEDCLNVVTFKLDDGTILEADREFLCEKSDFFSRLLNGHFKESNQDEISLPNVDPKSLNCLLELLKSADITKDLEIKVDLETLLDVIVLSDRYLLPDLCSSLVNSIEKFRISSRTVPVIYQWSLESGTNILRVESVAYALVANVDENERFRMFQKLFDLGYSSELLDDIHKLLVRYLSSFAR